MSLDATAMQSQQELISSIAAWIYQVADPDWDTLTFQASAAGNSMFFHYLRTVGGQTAFSQAHFRARHKDLSDWCRTLRAAMYTPGLGTWFGFTLTITRPQAVDVKFVYDEFPADDFHSVSPQMFVRDFERFPRDEAHTPGWLKAQLAEGRRLLGGGLEQDIKDGRQNLYDKLGSIGQIHPADAKTWQAGPESYAMIVPSGAPYGVVISDGLSDPDPVPGQPEGRGREMYLASQGFTGGTPTGWLIDVLRGVCNQIALEQRYAARFDVPCPTAPPDWSTSGVVSVGLDVNVPAIPEDFIQPNGHIQLIGVTLLRPDEAALVDPAKRSDMSPFLAKLRALPPEQATSLTRPSLA
ncbi:MAG: hypothetical protein FWF36_07020 [Propionibacteriaceae bacterium]|nr:hypothetical protein [Propionibacteriaceae bacterium]